jgi:hypothetical protein
VVNDCLEDRLIDTLEARHRAHARVEDRIRVAKDTGLGRPPVPPVQHQRRLARAGPAPCDLIAWTQTTLLSGELGRCEIEGAALPAADRRPHHPRPTPDLARTAAHLGERNWQRPSLG